jgi:hypothetical protein
MLMSWMLSLMMTKTIDEAVKLLVDGNLVWSSDFEDIKHELVALLIDSSFRGGVTQYLGEALASKIIYSDRPVVYDMRLERRGDA